MDAQQIITLKLSLAQVNTILVALGKQPLEVVLDAFAAVREQAVRHVERPVANGQHDKGLADMAEALGR